jgi:hypothetical protein
MRSRWLVCSPNTRIRIILIQQPEPSGSEGGRQSISLMLCWVVLHAINLRHGTDGLPSEGRARYGFLSSIKFHRPRPERNQQSHVSRGKHANHYTTEGGIYIYIYIYIQYFSNRKLAGCNLFLRVSAYNNQTVFENKLTGITLLPLPLLQE